MGEIFPLLVVLLIFAALVREDAVFLIFYLVLGLFIVGRFLANLAFNQIKIKRSFTHRAYLGQKVDVHLKVENTGRLPIVWAKIHESLPVGMVTPNFYHSVVSLAGKEKLQVDYTLHTIKRGCYPVGPLLVNSGDLFGLSDDFEKQVEADKLIIYPKIIPIISTAFISQVPYGSLAGPNPVFTDPSRVRGKRDYVDGDSLRYVDWKASASAGKPQVKQLEPAIAYEFNLFINLNPEDFSSRNRFELSELAIVTAASLASWSNKSKQPAGLFSNGIISDSQPGPIVLPARKGSGQFMLLLEHLAQIKMDQRTTFLELLQKNRPHLTWGSTAVLITPIFSPQLLNELFNLRRAGIKVIIAGIGADTSLHQAKIQAKHFGFKINIFHQEDDIKNWGRA
jgi:uncharacterized protein (DUF58 family)